MAITKRVETGEIRVRPDGSMNIRTDIILEEDGVEIHRSYHRKTIAADEELAADEDQFVKDLAPVVRTPERIQKIKDEHEQDRLEANPVRPSQQ